MKKVKKVKFGSKVAISTILATALLTSGATTSLDIFSQQVQAKSISTSPLTATTWETIGSFSNQFGGGFTQAQNGKLYVFGGFGGTTYLKRAIEIDPITKTVTTLPDLPTAIGFSGVSAIAANDGFIYIFGGINGADASLGNRFNNDVYKFNPNTYVYTKVGTIGFSSASGIRAIKASNDKIYLIGSEYSKNIYEYDITTYTSKVVGSFGEAKSGSTVISNPDDGNLYIFGGAIDYTGANTNKIYKFNPNTYEVSPAGVLPVKIRNMSGFFKNGKLFLTGGWSSDISYTADIWEYDPTTYDIVAIGTLPIPDTSNLGQTSGYIIEAIDGSLYFYEGNYYNSPSTKIYKLNLDNIYLTYEVFNIKSESADLSWTYKGTEDVTYEISRNNVLIYTGKELNYKDISLNPGTNYTYTLTIKDGSKVIATSSRNIQTLINPPSEVIIDDLTDESLNVKWNQNKNSPDTTYLVELETTKATLGNVLLQDNFDGISNIPKQGTWIETTTRQSEGMKSLKSPATNNSSSNSHTFTFSIPEGSTNGLLSFDSMSSSEANYDIFTATLNGTEIVKKSGVNTFTSYSKALSPGNYSLVFKYAKDGSGTGGDDAAYVDNLKVSYYGSQNKFSSGWINGDSYQFVGVDTTEGFQAKVTAKLGNLISDPVIAIVQDNKLADATNKVKIVEDFVLSGLENLSKIEEAETKYQVALDAVNELPNSEAKTALQDRLDIVAEDIKEAKAELETSLLEEMVKDLSSQTLIDDAKNQVNIAQTAINQLVDGQIKSDLQDRLNQCLDLINKAGEGTGGDGNNGGNTGGDGNNGGNTGGDGNNGGNTGGDGNNGGNTGGDGNNGGNTGGDGNNGGNTGGDGNNGGNTGGDGNNGGNTGGDGNNGGNTGGDGNNGGNTGGDGNNGGNTGGDGNNGGNTGGDGNNGGNTGGDGNNGGNTDGDGNNGGNTGGDGNNGGNTGGDISNGGNTGGNGSNNGNTGGDISNGGNTGGNGSNNGNTGGDISNGGNTGGNGSNNGNTGGDISNGGNTGGNGSNNGNTIGDVINGGNTGGNESNNGNTGGDVSNGGNTGGNGSNETTTSPFVDIQGHWSENSINKLYSLNIIKGISQTEFAPNREITRAEFATLVVRALNLKIENSEQIFTDVNNDKWYFSYINTAYKNNMVLGVGNNKFDPNGIVTRQEMATILARIIEQNSNVTFEKDINNLKEFLDYNLISDWAKSGSSLAVETKVIQGVQENLFAPKLHGTRAEASMVISRILDFLNK